MFISVFKGIKISGYIFVLKINITDIQDILDIMLLFRSACIMRDSYCDTVSEHNFMDDVLHVWGLWLYASRMCRNVKIARYLNM